MLKMKNLTVLLSAMAAGLCFGAYPAHADMAAQNEDAPIMRDSALSDADWDQLMIDLNSGIDLYKFMDDITQNYIRSVMNDHYKTNPPENGAKLPWTEADTHAAITRYLPAILPQAAHYARSEMARQLSDVQALALRNMIGNVDDKVAMQCLYRVAPDARDNAYWQKCEDEGGVSYDAETRNWIDQGQIALTAALTQPVINGALGGTVCLVAANMSRQMSSKEMTYNYSFTFALGSQEAPQKCEVLMMRWAALAGIEKHMALESEMALGKNEFE